MPNDELEVSVGEYADFGVFGKLKRTEEGLFTETITVGSASIRVRIEIERWEDEWRGLLKVYLPKGASLFLYGHRCETPQEAAIALENVSEICMNSLRNILNAETKDEG